MKPTELHELGIPKGEPILQAIALLRSDKNHAARFAEVAADAEAFAGDPVFGELARAILDAGEDAFIPRGEPAPWKQWARIWKNRPSTQMRNACDLPVAVAGALMPDAHLGYGLPIGGVLATEGCVIPYAVGVDIACRMKLTVLDLPVDKLDSDRDRLKSQLSRDTQFGIGASFKQPHDHDVMDADWSVSPITKQFKDKAWSQLGTSGSGNHFVEFGVLTFDEPRFGCEAGEYLALLSHSGSRGTGANVASHYSKRAQAAHADLPRELIHLAWLDLNSEDGAEYWAAMNLMGDYAAANHCCIHRTLAKNLGAEVLVDIENHHNFAWKETHFGKGRDRSPERRDPGRRRRPGDRPGIHGDAGLRGPRKRQPGIAELGRPRSRTRDEPNGSEEGVPLADREKETRRSRDHPAVRRTRRSAGRLQRHPHRDESPARSRRTPGPFRSKDRQDGQGGRTSGRLIDEGGAAGVKPLAALSSRVLARRQAERPPYKTLNWLAPGSRHINRARRIALLQRIEE